MYFLNPQVSLRFTFIHIFTVFIQYSEERLTEAGITFLLTTWSSSLAPSLKFIKCSSCHFLVFLYLPPKKKFNLIPHFECHLYFPQTQSQHNELDILIFGCPLNGFYQQLNVEAGREPQVEREERAVKGKPCTKVQVYAGYWAEIGLASGSLHPPLLSLSVPLRRWMALFVFLSNTQSPAD